MGHSPRVLKPGEEEILFADKLKGVKTKRTMEASILEIEGRYSLSDLKNMARAASISHVGDKEQLCHRLIAAGIIK